MANEQHRFQVNLGGIITLLSNNLYSHPGVFVRELLQNATDAINARRLADPAFGGGEVEFSIVADGPSPTLMVEDDGIGLTEDEVHRFLATIGESSKRDALGAGRKDFLGQFGIGLLSCFMVADEIVLITRSAVCDAPAVEWRGRPDGTYDVRVLSSTGRPGTTVYLRSKPSARDHFVREKLRERLAHFGSLLTVPVWLKTGGATRVHINEEAPPWRSARPERKALTEYGERLFEEKFLDAIPLSSVAGGVEGVAYVLSHAPSPSARQQHRLYLKNMLVSEQAQNLLPEWAFFVRCVVNAEGLRPTASREGFYEDAALDKAREELGECLQRWLVRMARTEPERLEHFLAVHHLAIKGLALHNDEVYRLFIDLLPFESSQGQITLKEYRAQNNRILYAGTVDQFRQIAAVAQAQNLCVINAGYVYEKQLLHRLPEFFERAMIERVDADSLARSFRDLTLEEHQSCFELLRTADGVLRRSNCVADVKRFEPAMLTALYNISDRGILFRSAGEASEKAGNHWSGILSGAVGKNAEPYARLYFNFNNELVRRLAAIGDKDLLTRLVEVVYVHALLAGHHPMSSHERQMLNRGLLGLVSLAADKPKEQA